MPLMLNLHPNTNKMDQMEPKKTRDHKPECLCWRCRRRMVPAEEFMPGDVGNQRGPRRSSPETPTVIASPRATGAIG